MGADGSWITEFSYTVAEGQQPVDEMVVMAMIVSK